MAYLKVGDVITQVRVLLQDEDAEGYRYSLNSLMQALNEGLLETRRLRPDIYRHRRLDVPQYTVDQLDQFIDYEQMYLPGLIAYTAGMAQLRDSEEATDQRAAALLNTFTTKLTAIA